MVNNNDNASGEDSRTTWLNDSVHTVKFKVLTTKKTGIKGSGVAFKEVVIPAGKTISLSSEYDQGIRTEDRNGIVVGGLCPWLKKVAEETPPAIHPCLDFEAVQEDQDLQKLAVKIEKEKALSEAIARKAEEKAEGILAGRKKPGPKAKNTSGEE